jgi:hypothetical protein
MERYDTLYLLSKIISEFQDKIEGHTHIFHSSGYRRGTNSCLEMCLKFCIAFASTAADVYVRSSVTTFCSVYHCRMM